MVIATIQLPLWTLAAAFCVLCLIPDVIEKLRAVKRVVTERATHPGLVVERRLATDVSAGRFDSSVQARSVTSPDNWARDGDWAA